MAITNRARLPIALFTTSATPHEVKHIHESLGTRFVKKLPKLLIGDRAYDSDLLDKSMRKKRIKMIAPHKGDRRKETKTQEE